MSSRIQCADGALSLVPASTNRCGLLFAAVVCLAATVSSSVGRADNSELAIPIFELDVLPLVQKHCAACHGGGKELSGGLSLLTPELMRRGGKSGAAIVDGQPLASRMIKRINDNSMPPKEKDRLTLEERDVLARWIGARAPTLADSKRLFGRDSETVSDEERDHFAFRPLRSPPLPSVTNGDRLRTPIDAFLLHRLERQGLTYSRDADGLALARRLSFDLTGLPPTVEQLDAFVYAWARNPDTAYDSLVDSLLASPHFGVTWARHWLDAVGYVDVCGSDENAPTIRLPRGGWRYRDYVVASLNNDKPYDRFLLEQIAGDELSDWRNADRLTPEVLDGLIATGFWRTAIDDTDQSVLNIPSNRYAVLFDQLEIFGSSVLGLTLQCARCHSHKYDPIPQRDYFRLMANLSPSYNVGKWVPRDARDLPDVSPKRKAEIDARNAEIDKTLQPLKQSLVRTDWKADVRRIAQKINAVPEGERSAFDKAYRIEPAKRNETQRAIVAKYAAETSFSDDERNAVRTADERREAHELKTRIGTLESSRPSYGYIQALYETGPPPPTRLLVRGEVERPGRPVRPGFLSVLSDSESSALQVGLPSGGPTSGRRLGLARWVTNPRSASGALAARVAVNRIWFHLFGRGIVASVGNFGFSGTGPTHPKLLDWLAHDFVDNGWKTKRLVRQLVRSTAYRQSSVATVSAEVWREIDPNNDLLWRARLRRLSSEAVRDAILRSSGQLDESRGGPPVMIAERADQSFEIVRATPTPSSHLRRTLYILSRRNYHVPMLAVFDVPAMTTNCAMRDQSTVVQQSLTMLNDDFVIEQAGELANVVRDVTTDPAQQIVECFKHVLSRTPTDVERKLSGQFLVDQTALFRKEGQKDEEQQDDEQNAESEEGRVVENETPEHKALALFAQMLLNSNNFLYLD